MIYTPDGRPYNKEFWHNFQIKRAAPRLPKIFPYEVDIHGNRLFRAVKDKLGDIIRIYRKSYVHRGRYTGTVLREIRALKGVGRPCV